MQEGQENIPGIGGTKHRFGKYTSFSFWETYALVEGNLELDATAQMLAQELLESQEALEAEHAKMKAILEENKDLLEVSFNFFLII